MSPALASHSAGCRSVSAPESVVDLLERRHDQLDRHVVLGAPGADVVAESRPDPLDRLRQTDSADRRRVVDPNAIGREPPEHAPRLVVRKAVVGQQRRQPSCRGMRRRRRQWWGGGSHLCCGCTVLGDLARRMTLDLSRLQHRPDIATRLAIACRIEQVDDWDRRPDPAVAAGLGESPLVHADQDSAGPLGGDRGAAVALHRHAPGDRRRPADHLAVSQAAERLAHHGPVVPDGHRAA